MPTKLKVSRKRATNGPSPAGLFVNSAVTSSLPTRKPSAVPMDDDGFWDNDDDILAVAPPVKKAKPDFLKTIMKKNQKKVAGVHEAQQELEAAVADDSEEEQDDLPATASQEVLENNCRQIEEKAAALDGGSGIQAPPSTERVLLPAKGVTFTPTIDEDFQRMATAAGGHAVEASELPTPGQVFERLLLSGSLRTLYFRTKPATEPIMRSLFECIYLHANCVVANAAYECLAIVFGASDHGSGLHRHGARHRRWASTLHGTIPIAHVAWSPSADDYGAALEACGLPNSHPKAPAKQRKGKKTAAGDGQDAEAAEFASETEATDVSLFRLKLVLRLLALHSANKRGGYDDEIVRLLPSLLRLHLDPAAAVYYQDLQVTVASILEAVNDREWHASAGAIAAQTAGLGLSHVGALHVLQQLPIHSARGADLQRLSAMLALRRVLADAPGVKLPKKLSATDSADISKGLVHTVEMLGGDAAALAKAAQKATTSESWNFWSVISAVQFADMVLWRPAKASADGDSEQAGAIRRWSEFLQIMGRNVRTITHDESQNRAKLLISEVSSYYDFIRRNDFL